MTNRPSVPRLHVIVPDPLLDAPDHRKRLTPVLEAGGNALALQLRARRTSARKLYEVAEWLMRHAADVGGTGVGGRDESAPRGPVVLVNDRLDVALAAGAGGVHLREDSMPPLDARALVGPSVLLGRSVHSADAVTELGGQVDYLILGATHATRSHPGCAPLGPQAVAAAARSSPAPVVAIGGITPRRAASLVRSGVHGVAVMSGIWRATNPAGAVGRHLDAVRNSIADRRNCKR